LSEAPAVTVVVGLGNPGDEYRRTRHNIGYLVIEEIRKRAGEPREGRRARALVSEAQIGDRTVVLARPRAYMNRSGGAVSELLRGSGAGPEELLVVCDDLYLGFGTLRLRSRGSHGGHNGLRSIIDALGTQEFPRLRVGVGPAGPDVAHSDFVLAPFPRAERERLPEVVEAAAGCVEIAVREGMLKAMNLYNRTERRAEGPGTGPQAR
jgi:PTH1 family peptidyl-tRNA hydrolase